MRVLNKQQGLLYPLHISDMWVEYVLIWKNIMGTKGIKSFTFVLLYLFTSGASGGNKINYLFKLMSSHEMSTREINTYVVTQKFSIRVCNNKYTMCKC